MLLRVQNWGKMAHLSPTKRTYLGNFICTNFVCNDSPLSKTISSFNSWSISETSLYPLLHLQASYLKANNEAWFILTMEKNNSEDTFVSLSWNTCKSTLSDVAELERTWTVSTYFWHADCWLKLLLLTLLIHFFCLQIIYGIFQDYAILKSLKSTQIHDLCSSEFRCTWILV